MTAPKVTELAARLSELSISPAECAAIVRRPVEEVTAWVDGESEPDGEAKILLRVLDDDHIAALAAEHVRHKQTLPLKRGDDWQTADVDRPYAGGFSGPTGGQPV